MSDDRSDPDQMARRVAPRGGVRRWAPWALVALVLAPLLAFATDRHLHSGRVLSGVTLSGVSFEGLDRPGAEARARELGSSLSKRRLSVRVDGRPHEIDPSQLGFVLDAPASAELALGAGRSGSLPAQLWFWLTSLRSPRPLLAVVDVDREKLLRQVEEWESVGLDLPFSGGVVADGGLRADPPRRGRRIDRRGAAEIILHALASSANDPCDLPLLESEPFLAPGAIEAALVRARRLLDGDVVLLGESGVELRIERQDLSKMLRSRPPTPSEPEVGLFFDEQAMDAHLGAIRAKVESAPRDARFEIDSQDRVVIVSSQPGALLSARAVAEAALQAAAAPARMGPLPIQRGAEPQVTTADLEALRIRRLVGKYTTHHACCQPRVENIHRIADLMRGTVVKPGQIYSINAMLGPRTTKNGFKPAPTIEEGEMVDSLGGGVSQFATTIFNALFLAGYDIKERIPHTYYFARYPMGRDATLSWPKPDIIFENDSEAGLLVWTEYTDKSITVKVFGDTGGRRVDFKVSAPQDVTRSPVEYIPDLTQDPETEKVKEGGQIGWTVFVTRELRFPDGTKREEKRKVIYKPRVRRLIVHPCKVPEGEPGHTGEKCPEKDEGAAAGPEP